MLDAYQMGRREPFLHRVVPDRRRGRWAGPTPSCSESVPRIQTVDPQEEEQFLRNLENGLQAARTTPSARPRRPARTRSPGEDAFTSTRPTASRSRSPRAWRPTTTCASTGRASSGAWKQHAAISRGTTEAAAVFATGPLDTLKKAYHHGSEFLGYADDRGRRPGHRHPRAEPAGRVGPAADGGTPVVLVLDRTPFYGESGGQVGDTGTIRGERFAFQVDDTKKDNDFILHVGQVVEGTVDRQRRRCTAEVDAERREAIRRAHSATHVLHHALHTHLGKHAQQAGSKVEPDRLRFDFANPEAVGRERLRAIEETVNQRVLRGERDHLVARCRSTEAKGPGAMALFGEKYPDIVRVVQMGEFSRELCGGTHLDNVGQVGLFKIVGEESVAAGTRRITALTGKAALDHVRQEEDDPRRGRRHAEGPAGPDRRAGRCACSRRSRR